MAIANRWQLSRWSAAICTLVIGLQVVATDSEPTRTTGRGDGDLVVEGAWSQVNNDWPLGEREFFVATERGHHFVRTKLPKELKRDLVVTFEYYYSYSKTMPVVQLTPCRENIFLFESMGDTKNRWARHTYRVKHSDCNARNELGYNTILHDKGDVFAWKKIEIREVESSAQPEPVLPNAPDSKRNELPTGADNQEQPSVREKSTNQKEAGDKNARDLSDIFPTNPFRPFSESVLGQDKPQQRPEEIKKPISSQDTKPKSPPAKVTKNDKKSSESASEPSDGTATTELDWMKQFDDELFEDSKKSDKSSEAEENADANELKPANAVANEQNKTPKNVADKPADSEATSFGPAEKTTGDEAGKQVYVKRAQMYNEALADSPDKIPPVFRAKRETTSKSSGKLHEVVCKPSSCNRHLFEMSAFSSILSGLPELSAADKQKLSSQAAYFVNLKNEPMKLKLQSRDELLEDVDSCVHLKLYMERGTQMELLLEDETDKRGRLLEVIKRESADSAAAHWDKFSRCISDYMPRYGPKPHQSKGNWLSFVLKPIGSQRPAQMAVLIDPKKTGSLRELHRVQNFLPDLRQMSTVQTLNKFWVIDRDGLDKAQVELKQAASGEGKVLHVSRIDPNQESFDLTSRWLQIKDAETLEQPIMFVYKADRVDWIERIDVQYQRAGASTEDWLTQEAYQAAKKQPAAGTSNSMADVSGRDMVDDGTKKIHLPIAMKGFDSNEFRLRVRHHLKRASGGTSSSGSKPTDTRHLSLSLASLAFADVCSYSRPYCRNEAPCKPTGSVTAECLCDTGYSGRFCEIVRPCEVLHEVSGELTATGVSKWRTSGRDLCKSIGARCVEELPVLRCEWNSDQFYQCKKLYKFDSLSGVYSSITGRRLLNGTGNSSTPTGGGESLNGLELPQPVDSWDDLEPEEAIRKLREENTEQAKQIIILTVFLVALVVFAVVLVGSMVSRLRVSSGRLRKAQSEVTELSRRQVLPMTTNGPRPTFSGRTAAGSGALAYNNSAFDVEL